MCVSFSSSFDAINKNSVIRPLLFPKANYRQTAWLPTQARF